MKHERLISNESGTAESLSTFVSLSKEIKVFFTTEDVNCFGGIYDIKRF